MNEETKQFVGTWELQAWSVVNVGSGQKRHAYGGNAVGHIMYTDDGWVSATLMETGRKAVSADRSAIQALKRSILEHPAGPLDSDQMDLMRQFYLACTGYVAYCGPFDVADGEVHHRVREALMPQMIDTTLTRKYQFVEDRLTLTATTRDIQDQLIWRRHD